MRRRAGRRRQEGGVVQAQVGIELPQRGRREGAVRRSGTVTFLPVRSSMMVMVSGTASPVAPFGAVATVGHAAGPAGTVAPAGGDAAVDRWTEPSAASVRAYRPAGPRSAAGVQPHRSLERRVVVLAGLEALALGRPASSRAPGDLGPGVGRVDDGVDVAPLGGDVGVEQALLVLRLALERAPRAWPGGGGSRPRPWRPSRRARRRARPGTGRCPSSWSP